MNTMGDLATVMARDAGTVVTQVHLEAVDVGRMLSQSLANFASLKCSLFTKRKLSIEAITAYKMKNLWKASLEQNMPEGLKNQSALSQ